MKKTLLLIIFVALLTNVGIAQDFHFGPKFGINLSNVYDSKDENFDADAKIGFTGGVFFSLPVGSFLGLQPEILFSQKGFKASGSILGNSYTFTRTLNYIDIPLLVALKPGEMFTILAGPQYSYLLSRKDDFKNSFLNIQQEQEFENDNLRKNTLFFLGGFDLNVNSVVIGARVGWDLYNNNGDGSSTTPRYKNVWYQATFGFRL